MSLFNDKVTLEPLTIEDAIAFYNIYAARKIQEGNEEEIIRDNESPADFTRRIVSNCEYIFTIRPKTNPEQIIGDSALHHWDRKNAEIQIGGSLLPDFRGQGFMHAAFSLLIDLASRELNVKIISAVTKTSNYKAIRLVEKMGFNKFEIKDEELILKKLISDKA